MCGFCGKLNFDNRTVEVHLMDHMAFTLVHRGPDDKGIYCDRFIGLGHRRLSIIDLSPKGKQPMWSNDRTFCIVFNGEVYNFKEIRRIIKAKNGI